MVVEVMLPGERTEGRVSADRQGGSVRSPLAIRFARTAENARGAGAPIAAWSDPLSPAACRRGEPRGKSGRLGHSRRPSAPVGLAPGAPEGVSHGNRTPRRHLLPRE